MDEQIELPKHPFSEDCPCADCEAYGLAIDRKIDERIQGDELDRFIRGYADWLGIDG